MHQINIHIADEPYQKYKKLHNCQMEYTWREVVEAGILHLELEEVKRTKGDE